MEIKKGEKFLSRGRPWSPKTQDYLCQYEALKDFNTETDEWWDCKVDEERICGLSREWYQDEHELLRRGIDVIEKVL